VTRVLAYSDLHAVRPAAEALLAQARGADLVIGAGDFCNMRQGLAEVMSWLEPIAAISVLVPGNAESADELRAATSARVLHGEAATFAGLRLFGLGYGIPVTPFGTWSCDLSEDEAARALDDIGATDILVTHAPPKGVVDVSSSGRSHGSTAIRDAITRHQPRVHVCGHIHECWGRRGAIGVTQVLNLGPAGTMLEV
jgi:Icc-related predicted phosphoesterase